LADTLAGLVIQRLAGWAIATVQAIPVGSVGLDGAAGHLDPPERVLLRPGAMADRHLVILSLRAYAVLALASLFASPPATLGGGVRQTES
jgi:hypothetical protein